MALGSGRTTLPPASQQRALIGRVTVVNQKLINAGVAAWWGGDGADMINQLKLVFNLTR